MRVSQIRDVLLDAEDNNLASRGAILDTEGQALLLRLRDLGPPDIIASGSAVAGAKAGAGAGGTGAAPQQRSSDTTTTHENIGAEGGGDGGWHAVESSLRGAISLRYVGRGGGRAGGRARYVEQLSDALRGLEQARYVCMYNTRRGGC